MAKTNSKLNYPSIVTHEGAPAMRESNLKELRRTLSSCLLFENTFYEGGDSIASRLFDLGAKVSQTELAQEIDRAKTLGLRHAPLWMAVRYATLYKGAKTGDLISRTITRADELAEFVAMYWRKAPHSVELVKRPITKQMKVGLGKAFDKFDEYQFAKYNRDGQVKLRDVMFLTHPRPVNGKASLYKKIAEDSLEVPNTWEVRLSSGADKKSTWEEMLQDNNLGALALLRNLRNMEAVGVDRQLVISALKRAKVKGILPFQFVTAWTSAPSYAKHIEDMMFRAMDGEAKLSGTTYLVVDVSGSMDNPLSGKGYASRLDAAGAIAVGLAERCDDLRVFTFSNNIVEVQPIRGLGMIKALSDSQAHSGTRLGNALQILSPKIKGERVIVITDEQTHDSIPSDMGSRRKFIVNVAPYQYGVFTDYCWTRISGFSANIVDWIVQEEAEPLFMGE